MASAQQLDTLPRMLELTFLHTLIALHNPALERRCLCPLSRLTFAIYVETGSELVPKMKKNKIVVMKCLKIIWLQFVQGKPF